MEPERLYVLLERISTLLRAEVRRSATQYDLPQVQLEALHYLYQCNRYSNTPAAITDFFGATKGTVSQTLRTLEEKGLIEKHADSDDARVVRCKLTARGKRIVKATFPPILLQETTDVLDKQTSRVLPSLLTTLLQGLQVAQGQQGFGICRTCAHFETNGNQMSCGLIKERLTMSDSLKICREHTVKAA